MGWLQLQLGCSRDAADAFETLLLDCGAVSVTLRDAEDEPLFEPGVGETPLWRALLLTGLFPGDADPIALELQLHALAPTALPPLHWERLPDQDWVRAWLDDFKPMRFGEKLWVCPSWWQSAEGIVQAPAGEWQPSASDAAQWAERNQALLAAMAAPDAVVLKLDPGLAFGTGTHPTTALCLRWLDAHPPKGQHVVDFGCGSGILGIAALLLGARSAAGIDTDPQALQATGDNCAKNQLDAKLFPVYLPEAFAARETLVPADGVLANILAGTLIDLAPQLCALARPGGWLLLSGILAEQAEAVMARFRPWCDSFDVVREGDWVSIATTRR